MRIVNLGIGALIFIVQKQTAFLESLNPYIPQSPIRVEYSCKFNSDFGIQIKE